MQDRYLLYYLLILFISSLVYNLSGRILVKRIVIIASSLLFFAILNSTYVILFLLQILLNYFLAKKISNQKSKKDFLFLSLIINVGSLALFKIATQTQIGWILPIGISYYTLQVLAFHLDLYRSESVSNLRFWPFVQFHLFFPNIVAGPIERTNLYKQFVECPTNTTKNFYRGMTLILFGIAKKFIVANFLAKLLDPLFVNHGQVDSISLLGAILLYPFQLFYDFSSLADMAIGAGLLFGIKISLNFNRPFYSQNMIEFWQKWHITLSTWVRDYIYMPLGISSIGMASRYLPIILSFGIIGIWHNLNLNFLIYGLLHGHIIYFQSSMKRPFNVSPLFKTIFNYFFFISTTFLLMRFSTFQEIFSFLYSLLKFEVHSSFFNLNLAKILIFILIFELVEKVNDEKDLVSKLYQKGYFVSLTFFAAFINLLLFFGEFSGQFEFIYPGY